MAGQEKVQRDAWDKLEVISKILAAILLPLVLGLGGWWLNGKMEAQKQEEARRQEEQKRQEARNQLYMTLMNQREKADSDLRKDMFQHIIRSVVGQKDEDIKLHNRVLNLELLAHNFHDSIDLRALFYSVQRELLERSKQARTVSEKKKDDELKARLKSVAAETRKRQFSALKERGNAAYFTVDLKKVGNDYEKPPLTCLISEKDGYKDEYLILSPLEKQGDRKKFRIRTQVLSKNEETEELNVRVQIVTRDEDGTVDLQSAEMWVGFFDFPAIDNIRLLGSDHRCAVVLNHFDEPNEEEKETARAKAKFAKISVIVFPGCRASLKPITKMSLTSYYPGTKVGLAKSFKAAD
jgi:hypothetical protein